MLEKKKLGIHLILLGRGVFLLKFKVLYFGGYVIPEGAPMGRDVRTITNLTLSPSVIRRRMDCLCGPFGI